MTGRIAGWTSTGRYVGGRIRVRPSWWDAQEGTIDLIVDPGQAFGTGAHPTTRLCLALLLELDEADRATGALVDWGTGSGVLAIAAAKLGFEPVTACDRELASLEAARENAEANGVEVAVERVDVREGGIPVAPTVVANLTAPLLAECARGLEAAASAPATLVCSGTLETETGAVAAAFEPCGLAPAGRRVEGDWASLLLRAVPG